MQRVLSFPPQSNRRFGDPSEFVSKRMCFSFMFSIAFLAVLAGFLLGRFVFDQELELSKAKLRKANQQQVVTGLRQPEPNASTLISQISSERIQQHLRSLQDGNPEGRNLREARLMTAFMKEAAFDLVSSLVDSQTSLSYPDPDRVNQVVLLHGKDARLIINDSRTGLSSSGGYRTSATVTGNVFYVNFGRDEDYHHLDSLGLNLKDSIVIARVGRVPPVDLVTNALDHDAVGIILYRDPQQKDMETVFLTPDDLARLQSHKNANGNAAVPVICITSRDAERLFGEMSTSESSSESWRGELNSTYPIGPGFGRPDRRLAMTVNTVTVAKKFYDVFGALRGTQEPGNDVMQTSTCLVKKNSGHRFVMVAHVRTPDETGQESTAIVMEMVRAFGALMKANDWRPYRSVVFASWGTDGNYHSHASDWWLQLKMKAVAYLKVESALLGNNTASSRGTPLLERAFREASAVVPLGEPHLDLMLQTGEDVNLVENGIPFLELKQHGIDRIEEVTSFWSVLTWKLSQSGGLPFTLDPYAKFFNHSLGVIEQRYKMLTQKHSLFLDLIQDEVDAAILRQFQRKLSYEGAESSLTVKQGMKWLLKLVSRTTGYKNQTRDLDNESFFEATQRLIVAISSFQYKWSFADAAKSIDMRIMNDKFLSFSHALSCRKEKSDFQQFFRHAIFSRSTRGHDPTAGFGLLQDLLRETTSTEAPDDLQQQIVNHLVDLVECLNAARYALTDGLENFVRAEE